MEALIFVCGAIAGILPLVGGVLYHYDKQIPALWTTSTAIAFILLGVTLFLHNSINIKIKENLSKKANYSQMSVIKQMSVAYNYLFETCKQTIKPTGYSTIQEKYKATKVFLGYLNHNVEKLNSLVILNNIALDKSSMPLVTKFNENIQILLKLLSYFSELHNPEKKVFDFVSEGPFARMRELEAIIQKLYVDYPEAILAKDAGIDKSVDEIEILWKEVDSNNERLCLTPGKYMWKPGRVPNVFNPDNMRQLSVPTIPNAKTYLSYGYE